MGWVRESGRATVAVVNHHVHGQNGSCRVGAPWAHHPGLESMMVQIEHDLHVPAPAMTGDNGVADHRGRRCRCGTSKDHPCRSSHGCVRCGEEAVVGRPVGKSGRLGGAWGCGEKRRSGKSGEVGRRSGRAAHGEVFFPGWPLCICACSLLACLLVNT
jgi:hypothetical protein